MGVREKQVLVDGSHIIASVYLMTGDNSDYTLELFNELSEEITCQFKLLKLNGKYELIGARIPAYEDVMFEGTDVDPSGHSYITVEGYNTFKVQHINHSSVEEREPSGNLTSHYRRSR